MTSVIILCCSGITTAEENVTGRVNDTVTLPCTYSARNEAAEVCWIKAMTCLAEAENVIGSINDTVTLPCAYSAGKQVTRLRWRRCGCSQLGCPDAINWTNNSGVITKSSRYHILRNITQGDVSLTITSLTMEDEGVYCCKVYIQGPSNDVKKEVTIQILANGERLKWNTPANVIRGIIIFLVPTIFLLIYKCCSLQS
ncbi:hepatitis A virus cellular receptor 1 homolog isoform X2 [Rhinoderma darwinii]|uniref:hepatitis A virus cellular receptor 1 homolog isoform X2 n=1 Tax=Rhinoderma darwinii TaxID=43563 RepID=UPI003F666E07